MGVVVTDLGNKQHSLDFSWWAWRPLLRMILTSGVLTEENRVAAIEATDVLEASPAEAKAIAAYLEKNVLSEMKPTERLLHHGAVTEDSDDGQFHRQPEDAEKNYTIDHATLTAFIEFCNQCEGFDVN